LALSARRCLARDAGHPDRAAWISLLRTTLERAGPAFIKYGQWAATRHDLFPRDVCSELERLHASAPAHPRAVTAAAVEDAFGASLDDLFDGFPDRPVASGSIGQVYRARLSDNGARRARLPAGTVVAVKVRHPGVQAAIARDFAIMMTAARAATALIPALTDARFAETLAQFEAPLREQVDFEHEARSLWRFCYNFRERDGVRFPQPVYPLVSPAVLVETFESGGAIGEHVAAGPGGRYGTALARLGSDAVLHMLLVDNFVHADLVRVCVWWGGARVEKNDRFFCV
jgi:aarF domain-containing kinase